VSRDRIPGGWFLLILFTLASFAAPVSVHGQSKSDFESVAIGAFDPEAWNGLVFLARAHQKPVNFALRVGSRSGTFLDGNDIFNAVSEVGPHAPDGSYCRMSWKNLPREAPITLEWSRIDDTMVVARLTAASDLQLVLETYFTDGVQGGIKASMPSIRQTRPSWANASWMVCSTPPHGLPLSLTGLALAVDSTILSGSCGTI